MIVEVGVAIGGIVGYSSHLPLTVIKKLRISAGNRDARKTARLHNQGRTPAKGCPGMRRRLSVPSLSNRNQVSIAVIIEVDRAIEGVSDSGDMAHPVIIHRNIVTIAIFDLSAVPLFVLVLAVAHLRARGITHQQSAAVVG